MCESILFAEPSCRLHVHKHKCTDGECKNTINIILICLITELKNELLLKYNVNVSKYVYLTTMI